MMSFVRVLDDVTAHGSCVHARRVNDAAAGAAHFGGGVMTVPGCAYNSLAASQSIIHIMMRHCRADDKSWQRMARHSIMDT